MRTEIMTLKSETVLLEKRLNGKRLNRRRLSGPLRKLRLPPRGRENVPKETGSVGSKTLTVKPQLLRKCWRRSAGIEKLVSVKSVPHEIVMLRRNTMLRPQSKLDPLSGILSTEHTVLILTTPP
jgi:hypothetical protein